ncbi:unnamed protein product, partial [Amoebophrya sp. A25]|eukprot:GSA25T00002150001.1
MMMKGPVAAGSERSDGAVATFSRSEATFSTAGNFGATPNQPTLSNENASTAGLKQENPTSLGLALAENMKGVSACVGSTIRDAHLVGLRWKEGGPTTVVASAAKCTQQAALVGTELLTASAARAIQPAMVERTELPVVTQPAHYHLQPNNNLQDPSKLFSMVNEDLQAEIRETEYGGEIKYFRGGVSEEIFPTKCLVINSHDYFQISKDYCIVWNRDDTRVFVAVSQLTSNNAKLSGRLAPHWGRHIRDRHHWQWEMARKRQERRFSMWWDNGGSLRESPQGTLQYYKGRGKEMPTNVESGRLDIPFHGRPSIAFVISPDNLIIGRYRCEIDGRKKFIDAYLCSSVLEASARDTKDWVFTGSLAQYDPLPASYCRLGVLCDSDESNEGQKSKAVFSVQPQRLQIKGSEPSCVQGAAAPGYMPPVSTIGPFPSSTSFPPALRARLHRQEKGGRVPVVAPEKSK